jgi:NhaP-type Na+/H+ or K+/H+ antiporter
MDGYSLVTLAVLLGVALGLLLLWLGNWLAAHVADRRERHLLQQRKP